MRQLILSAALAACVLGLPSSAWCARIEPTEAALKSLETLRARSMGVDRAGNLWAWDPQLQTVALLAPSGNRLASYSVPGARAVDADADWGVVALVRDGRELRWFRGRQGQEDVTLALEGPASEVCWVGNATVAIAPQTSAYRVGIWNLKDKALVKTLGEEAPLHPTFGATRMRAVVMRYDFAREQLYTLESYLGELQVFTLDGKQVWRASVEHPLRAETEKWLLDADRQAKERKDVQTPVVYWFYLGLDGQGDAWVVRNVDAAAKMVEMVKPSPAGSTDKRLENQTCASRNFTFWGDWLIFYTDPAAPREVCVADGARFQL